jgi:hypothetical protein
VSPGSEAPKSTPAFLAADRRGRRMPAPMGAGEGRVVSSFDLGLVIEQRRVARLAESVALLPLPKLPLCFLGRRHAAVDDHAPGQPDGRLRVAVLGVDMFDVGQAMAGGVLDAPAAPRRRPLHLAPNLPVDGQVIGAGVDLADLDHPVASAIALFHRAPPS